MTGSAARSRSTHPILVVGGVGLLGQALVARLRQQGRAFAAPPRAELDLTDAAGVTRTVERIRPAAVINAAAFTDVSASERGDRRAEVLRINRDGPAQLAALCERRGIPLAHVSTDFVFDGAQRRPYRETDEPAPLQHYGRSKLEGERAILAAHPAALVARTSTLFGPWRGGRPHYVDAILRQAALNDRVSVVAAPIASPTFTLDLATMILELLDVGARGIVHTVNASECSRLELAREAVRLAHRGRSVTVEAREPDEGGPRRPVYCALDVQHGARLLGRTPRPWNDALAEYLERWWP